MIVDLAKSQARIYLAIILLLCMVLPAGIVWLRMDAKLDAKYDLGKAEATTACVAADLGALTKAMDDAAKRQAEIDASAAAAADALVTQLGAARRNIATASTRLAEYANENPLDPSCVAPPERVRLANEGRPAAAD
ncbi:MAG: hypothetical protein ACRC2H_01060 [Silanimonas sp.]